MVRFSWHVEDGLNASLPPGALLLLKESGVRHANCEIEIPGSKEPLEAVFTLPSNYLDADKVKETGVVLGHGSNVADYKGKLLTDIAVHLASKGYVVIRYACKYKEQRRQRSCEKALDAVATSPFARSITKWVLAGMGTGARVAATVGNASQRNVVGYVMLSYPLTEHVPQPIKSRRGGEGDDLPPPPKTSDAPLMQLSKPVLFLLGDSDEFCTPGQLREISQKIPSPDIRAEIFEDANQDFRSSQGRGPAAACIRRLCSLILEYVAALNEENLSSCAIPAATALPASPEAGDPDTVMGEADAPGEKIALPAPGTANGVQQSAAAAAPAAGSALLPQIYQAVLDASNTTQGTPQAEAALNGAAAAQHGEQAVHRAGGSAAQMLHPMSQQASQGPEGQPPGQR